MDNQLIIVRIIKLFQQWKAEISNPYSIKPNKINVNPRIDYSRRLEVYKTHYPRLYYLAKEKYTIYSGKV